MRALPARYATADSGRANILGPPKLALHCLRNGGLWHFCMLGALRDGGGHHRLARLAGQPSAAPYADPRASRQPPAPSQGELILSAQHVSEVLANAGRSISSLPCSMTHRTLAQK